MKPEGDRALLRSAAARLDLLLEESQIRLLLDFAALLRERAVPLGIIGPREAEAVLERHIVDSLRAAPLVDRDRDALDLGSGAGLPGVVLAVARPALQVGLVEPRRRRAAFLEMALERLGLVNARVIPKRAEDLDGRVDLCLTRALAPLEGSWDRARPLLRPGGRLVYFAGPVGSPPSVPPGAVSVRVVAEKRVDSPGPLVIITRQ